MTPEAEAVRSAYRLRRQMHQPKWNGSSSRWDTCWQKTADFIASSGIGLEEYLNAQFEYKAPFPMPNQLYNAEAMKRYELYRDRQADSSVEAVWRLELELDFLETRLDVGFDLEEILSFPGSPLTPLFCYCVAISAGRNDLAVLFESGAKKQVALVPNCRELYRGLLPEGHPCR